MTVLGGGEFWGVIQLWGEARMGLVLSYKVSRELPPLSRHVRTPQEVYSAEDGLHQNPNMLPSSSWTSSFQNYEK